MQTNVFSWLEKWADYRPQRLFMRRASDNREWTYSDFHRASLALAAALQSEFDLGKGDRVAILAQNSVEHILLFFAAIRLGSILVPLNYRLTSKELNIPLRDAEAKLIFVANEYADTLATASEGTQPGRVLPLTYVEEYFAASAIPAPASSARADEPVMILYTSGTTGRPKGVIITHEMLFWNSLNTTLRLDLTSSDHSLSFAPFFHTGGWNVLLTPFIHRGASHTLLEKFAAAEILRRISSERVTLLFGVPTMLKMLAEDPGFTSSDLTSMRYIIVGGAPMPLPLIDLWHERNIPIRQGYGLTEVGPNTFSLHQDNAHSKMGSIGKPNFYIEAKVLDEAGRECPANRPGELCLKSPVVTPGYWRDTAATQASLRDGWFHTGDIVRKDEDGFFYVVDRKKNMYISGGENVYPLEVERVLCQHAAIKEAAVIGVADARWGETGAAFLVPAQGEKTIIPDDLAAYARHRLATYKVPKHYFTIPDLPLTDSGKVDRKKLLEMYHSHP
jgi:fatty-acyl-CoA synthase